MTEPLSNLSVLFANMSAENSALRARLLTSLLNESIAAGATGLRCPDDWGEEWKAAVSGLKPQPISLALPWQAYHFAQAGKKTTTRHITRRCA